MKGNNIHTLKVLHCCLLYQKPQKILKGEALSHLRKWNRLYEEIVHDKDPRALEWCSLGCFGKGKTLQNLTCINKKTTPIYLEFVVVFDESTEHDDSISEGSNVAAAREICKGQHPCLIF